MTPVERIAHDIICIVKYGSPGGSAPSADVKRVADYLMRNPVPPAVRAKTPALPEVKVALPAIKVKLP